MKQAQGSVSAPAIKASLAALIERLQQLKQRVEGADTDEALVLACLQARVAHLRMGISTKCVPLAWLCAADHWAVPAGTPAGASHAAG